MAEGDRRSRLFCVYPTGSERLMRMLGGFSMTNTAWLTGPPLEAQQTEWLLEKDDYLIGNEPPADLVVPLSRVSPQHAQIIRDGRGYAIRDLDSRNGTFVNGKPIGADFQPLKDGDQIGL